MSSNDNDDKGNDSPPTDLKGQDQARMPGKEAHGGDVAPPNSDDAGRRLSPESGPPDKH